MTLIYDRRHTWLGKVFCHAKHALPVLPDGAEGTGRCAEGSLPVVTKPRLRVMSLFSQDQLTRATSSRRVPEPDLAEHFEGKKSWLPQGSLSVTKITEQELWV